MNPTTSSTPLVAPTLVPAQKPRRMYELRYTGTFGNSLYARAVEYEDLLIQKRNAIAAALAAGQRQLAASFDIV